MVDFYWLLFKKKCAFRKLEGTKKINQGTKYEFEVERFLCTKANCDCGLRENCPLKDNVKK